MKLYFSYDICCNYRKRKNIGEILGKICRVDPLNHATCELGQFAQTTNIAFIALNAD